MKQQRRLQSHLCLISTTTTCNNINAAVPSQNTGLFCDPQLRANLRGNMKLIIYRNLCWDKHKSNPNHKLNLILGRFPTFTPLSSFTWLKSPFMKWDNLSLPSYVISWRKEPLSTNRVTMLTYLCLHNTNHSGLHGHIHTHRYYLEVCSFNVPTKQNGPHNAG